jgi:hypothetical protein
MPLHTHRHDSGCELDQAAYCRCICNMQSAGSEQEDEHVERVHAHCQREAATLKMLLHMRAERHGATGAVRQAVQHGDRTGPW